jgi:hypothetical protein
MFQVSKRVGIRLNQGFPTFLGEGTPKLTKILNYRKTLYLVHDTTVEPR